MKKFGKNQTLLLALVCGMQMITQAKVLVFTYAFNRPDLLEIQTKTLKKFMLDEYTFTVFNDATDPHMETVIQDKATELGIEYVRIPQEIHRRPYLRRLPGEDHNHPAVRNVNAVMYSLNERGFMHDDVIVLLDSDLFLVKPLSVTQLMQEYDIAGRFLTPNNRVGWIGNITYLWHGLAFLNMKTMPDKQSINFNCGRIRDTPVDAGGYSHLYIAAHPNLRICSFDHTFSNELKCFGCKATDTPTCTHNTYELTQAGLDEHQIRFFQSVHNGHANGLYSVEFFHNNSFLHYRCGTNWEHQTEAFHEQKTAALNLYIEAIMQR